MARSVCVGLVGVLWLIHPPTAVAQVPEELRTAEALAARIETAERSPALAGDLDRFLDLPTVDAELEKVRSYLRETPEDAAALLLSVRLGRVHDLLALREAVMAAFSDPAGGMPERPSYAPYQETLDRVLAHDSTIAAAHHWKARLLLEERMMAVEFATEGTEPTPGSELGEADAARLLHHAGAAVALDSNNVVYREFYAALLVDDGRLNEATEVMSHPSTSGSLLQLLTGDLLTFAPPPGAEPDAVLQSFHFMTGMMAAANSDDPSLSEFLEVRLQAWSTPASLEDVEAHYRSRWPDVTYFAVDAWEGAITALFSPAPDGWYAVHDSVALENDDRNDGDLVSLLLLPPEVVAELAEGAAMQGVPDEMLKSGPRVGILYENWRRSPAPNGKAAGPAVPPPEQRESDAVLAGVGVASGGVPPRPTILPLEGPLYRISRDGYWGLIDSLGNVVLEPALEEIDGTRGGLSENPAVAWIALSDDGYRPVTNFPVWVAWSGRRMLLMRDGSYVPMDDLQPQGRFVEGRLAVRRDGKTGFIDERGTLVIPPLFDRASPFRDGHAFVQLGNRWGTIDRDGNMIIEPTWDEANQDGWGDSEWVSVRV